MTPFRGDIDHALPEGVVRRTRKPVKTFKQRSRGDTTTKGSPQSAYSKSGRWCERGGTHNEFVSPFPADQDVYWRRYWRTLFDD